MRSSGENVTWRIVFFTLGLETSLWIFRNDFFLGNDFCRALFTHGIEQSPRTGGLLGAGAVGAGARAVPLAGAGAGCLRC